MTKLLFSAGEKNNRIPELITYFRDSEPTDDTLVCCNHRSELFVFDDRRYIVFYNTAYRRKSIEDETIAIMAHYCTQQQISKPVSMNPNFFDVTSIAEYILRNANTAEKKKCFTLFFTRQGNSQLFIHDQPVRLSRNSICLILPNTRFAVEASPDTDGYVIQFDLVFLQSTANQIADTMLRQFPPVSIYAVVDSSIAKANIYFIVEALYTAFTHSGMQQPQLIAGWLSMLLHYVVAHFPAPPSQNKSGRCLQIAAAFYALLERDFQAKRSVADYASALHMDPDHLTFVIKQASGHSTRHHIKERILREAKRLALYTNETMKSIGYRLGFDEPAHFSRFFKINCGQTFREFKRCNIAVTNHHEFNQTSVKHLLADDEYNSNAQRS